MSQTLEIKQVTKDFIATTLGCTVNEVLPLSNILTDIQRSGMMEAKSTTVHIFRNITYKKVRYAGKFYLVRTGHFPMVYSKL